jgi:hypothetical protein
VNQNNRVEREKDCFRHASIMTRAREWPAVWTEG